MKSTSGGPLLTFLSYQHQRKMPILFKPTPPINHMTQLGKRKAASYLLDKPKRQRLDGILLPNSSRFHPSSVLLKKKYATGRSILDNSTTYLSKQETPRPSPKTGGGDAPPALGSGTFPALGSGTGGCCARASGDTRSKSNRKFLTAGNDLKNEDIVYLF